MPNCDSNSDYGIGSRKKRAHLDFDNCDDSSENSERSVKDRVRR